MSKDLRLHRELGVNPRLCFCPRCGGDSPMLVLAGDRNYVDTCDHCGMKHYGGLEKVDYRGGQCQGCGRWTARNRRQLEPNERFPGEICDACKKEMEEHKVIVLAGGVYFRCKQCKQQGVVRANEWTKLVREKRDI